MTLTSPAPIRQHVRTPLYTRLLLAIVAFLTLCTLMWPAHELRYDLRVYVVAARAFLHGHDIYTAHLAYPDDMVLGFTYPPFAAIVFAPIAMLGTEAGRLVMTWLSALSLLVIGVLTVKQLRPAAWSRQRTVLTGCAVGAAGLTLEPIRSCLDLGQVNVLLTAVLMLDLLGAVPRRYRGLLTGVVTGIKLTPGIFIVFLLATRRYREAAQASAAAAGTIAIGWLLMPSASATFWGDMISNPRVGATHFISNQSVRGVFARISHGTLTGGPIWLVVVAAIGVLGLLVATNLHAAGYRLEALLVTACAGLLVSPVSWTAHWTWAVPITAVLWVWTFRQASPVLFGITVVWTVTMTVGLPWLAPYLGDRELTHTGGDLLLGNSYAIVTALVLTTAAFWSAGLSAGRSRAEHPRAASARWSAPSGPSR